MAFRAQNFGVGAGSGNASERFQVAYSGTLSGRAIEARVTRNQKDSTPVANSLLGSATNQPKVLMVLSDDECELRVMEDPSGSDPKFYSLKRQEGPGSGLES